MSEILTSHARAAERHAALRGNAAPAQRVQRALLGGGADEVAADALLEQQLLYAGGWGALLEGEGEIGVREWYVFRVPGVGSGLVLFWNQRAAVWA